MVVDINNWGNKIRSFDVFDTLIARRYIHHETVWEKMGREIDIPNFATHRAACNYGTLRDIYWQLANKNVIQHSMQEQLMELEIQYEQASIFPIKEIMDQVRHGDLLVSDMYHSPPDILRLVRSAGLDRQVTIHASLADKQTGVFWKAMRGHLNVESHTGDNGHADIALASQEGFKVVHYTKSSPTVIEKELLSKGLSELAMLVRETRLRNHEPAEEIFTIANQLNLPWLFICCELLRRKHPNKKPVFLGRDCQLFYKIFNSYFNEASYYIPFSRRAALKDPQAAITYLKAHVPQNYILVDISSTGRTWNILGQHHVFDIEIVHYDQRDGIPTPKNFTSFHQENANGSLNNKKGTNLLLEVFNCANHGMLDHIEMVNGLPIAQFDPNHELDPEFIRVVQQPMMTAIELRKFYDNMTFDMTFASDQTLWYFFDKFPRSICQYQPGLRTGILKSYYDRHEVYVRELTSLNY